LFDHIYIEDGTVFPTKISAILKWVAVTHTQQPSESHCPTMKQEMGRGVDYRDLGEGIHSITLNGRRKVVGGRYHFESRELCSRQREL